MNDKTHDSLSDESLLERLQNQDHEAFSTLVSRHTRMFYAAAYRICPNQDDAEDVVQDAFLKLWNNPSLWDASKGAKFTTWFYRVVTNQALDLLRKKKKTQGIDVSERITSDDTMQDDALVMSEEQRLLEEAIQELPERQMMALNLCFYEGLSNKEAADILDVSVKALESLLIRAKSGVKDILIRKGVIMQEKEKEYGS